jgi:hypothetical protein
MRKLTSFYPERQFHILINFSDDERSIAVLPDETGSFLVVDQGKVLGQLAFDNQLNCVSCECDVDETILNQLLRQIRSHYSFVRSIFTLRQ